MENSKKLENLILNTKPRKRWGITADIAMKIGYKEIGKNSYNKQNDYILKIKKDIFYFDQIKQENYKTIKQSLESNAKINSTYKLLADASTLGMSSIGGAALGYALMSNEIIPVGGMVLFIVVPPAATIISMIRSSGKYTKMEKENREKIEPYNNKIFKNEEAIKKFLKRR